jgi:hypothetical protein
MKTIKQGFALIGLIALCTGAAIAAINNHWIESPKPEPDFFERITQANEKSRSVVFEAVQQYAAQNGKRCDRVTGYEFLPDESFHGTMIYRVACDDGAAWYRAEHEKNGRTFINPL